MTIYLPKLPVVGIHTLGVISLNGKQIVLIETGLPGRIDWVATCFDPYDRLIPAAAESLASYPRLGKRWDSLRYGPYFLEALGGDLDVYYNGIKEVGSESGGQIGHSKVDRATLERVVVTKNCH